ncbi:MAG: transcriptional regulator [Candidatus Sericytochromatia bacterium]|nr:transcriptional regulator [Candidatus Sericytochromatia bacterium]
MILGSDVIYDALIARFVPRALHDEQDYEQAIAIIEGLLAKPELHPSEQEYLSLITQLVAAYEASNDPVADVSGVEMVRFLMDQHNLKQKDLVDIFKTPSILSEVLSGKRELNKSHIEGLARRFQVSPAVFFETV